MDMATQMSTRISFARVCVEVEAGKELSDSVVIESKEDGREVFPIVYDWKPQACFHCQTFGHDDALCCKRPRLPTPVPKVSMQDEFTSREKGGPSKANKAIISQGIQPRSTATYMPKIMEVSNKFQALSDGLGKEMVDKHIEGLKEVPFSTLKAAKDVVHEAVREKDSHLMESPINPEVALEDNEFFSNDWFGEDAGGQDVEGGKIQMILLHCKHLCGCVGGSLSEESSVGKTNDRLESLP
ncbi:hypothetical protein QJS10_CPB14g01039 [Acorus calamus]|uniref:Uncharacterized protein n=1 Tax=Acorus calamus TaxID=4465 RepID=A0AAV9DBL3_ACOCL|nr:hypothetical protein QJS10_CPB14g01039 [Acorus calamus]